MGGWRSASRFHDQIHERKQCEEGRFIWIHGLEFLAPGHFASIVSGPELSQKEYQNREHGRNKAAHLLEERAERGHGPETKYTLEGCSQ